MTMYYAHSKEKKKPEAQGRVWKRFLEVNGGCNGGRRQFSSKIVDGERVYNNELTASKLGA